VAGSGDEERGDDEALGGKAVVLMKAARPSRRWDPFRLRDIVDTLWSTAAAFPPVSSSASAAYQTLFSTLRRLVLDRRLTMRLDSGEVTLTVTEFAMLDTGRLAAGQLDDVRITATEIDWESEQFERAEVVLRNVHLRPGAPPMVVAAPVELSLDVPTAAIDGLFLLAVPKLSGEVGDDGIARMRWARRPGLGNVELDVHLDGSTLVLQPRAVALGRRRLALPTRTPSYRVRLPRLPHDLELTDVQLEPGLLRVSGTLPEWRIEMTRRRLEDAVTKLANISPLSLTRAYWRPLQK
jgi:hypothetical protein